MTIKTSLLGSAALSVICALSVTSAADAATKHKHAAASTEPSLADQVKQLQATVEQLEQTVQAQAAAQQQSQAATAQQLQDAQARADAATAAAKAAQAKLDMQIEQIPGAVQTAIADQPKPTLDKLKYKGVTVTPGGSWKRPASTARRTSRATWPPASRRSPSRTRRSQGSRSSAPRRARAA